MGVKLIPIKNVLLAEEQVYLDKQLQQGFSLRKKGLLFYYFTKVPLESEDNQRTTILLLDCDEALTDLEAEKLTILTETKTNISNKRLVYAIGANNSRWLLEDAGLLKWYQGQQGRYLNYANLFGIPGLLILVLMLTPFAIPSFIFLLSPLLLALAVYNLRKTDFSFEGAANILYEMGKLTGFEAEYILSFPKSNQINCPKLEQELFALGQVKKMSGTTYKIKTPLTREELADFIMEAADLNQKDFQLMHIGELYVMA